MSKQLVIVYTSYGNLGCMPGTFERAMKLFQENLESDYTNLDSRIKEYSEDTTHTLVSPSRISSAIQDIINLEVGQPSIHLRALHFGNGPRKRDEEDTRPLALVTQENKAEVALWLMTNKLLPDRIKGVSGSTLYSTGADKLQLLAPMHTRLAKPALIVEDDYYFQLIDSYELIVKGKWKADLSEERKVRRIVEFVNEHMAGRDTKYELTTMDD